MNTEKTGLPKEIEDILYDIEGSLYIKEKNLDDAAKKIEELVKREAIRFCLWHMSMEYLKDIVSVVGSSKTKKALKVFEIATIKKRYELYLESKDNDN